jgi:predicted unusual protein kinase regulating ubiquinone biosynthesis (AarF/ABC1/UbiB family)
MDFRNEALNAQRMAALLAASDFGAARQLVIPQPLMELTTRRVLTMEWVTGVKLTTLQVCVCLCVCGRGGRGGGAAAGLG